MMRGYFAKDGAKGSWLDRIMGWDRKVELTLWCADGVAAMGSTLTAELIAKGTAESFLQVMGGEITGQFHTKARTSS